MNGTEILCELGNCVCLIKDFPKRTCKEGSEIFIWLVTLLTVYSAVLLEKLIFCQLTKKIPLFYAILTFTSML